MLPIIGLDPQRHLKIPIKNKCLFFTANKVSIEVALLDVDGNTSHFDIDFKDFILIPTACNPESIRYFKSFYPHPITAEIFGLTIDNLIDSIQIENSMIRVRVHAFHEFTGLGKSFEKKFVYKNNEFKIK